MRAEWQPHIATRAEAQERFRGNVKVNDDGCWIWQRQSIPFDGLRGGYGLAHTPKYWGLVPKTTAHRVSWYLFHGDIPDDMIVCHRCDVRLCVNPDHLFLGSDQTNTVDMIAKDRHPGVMQTRLRHGDVAEMVAARRNGESNVSIAKRYGYSPSYISHLIKRDEELLTALPALADQPA